MEEWRSRPGERLVCLEQLQMLNLGWAYIDGGLGRQGSGSKGHGTTRRLVCYQLFTEFCLFVFGVVVRQYVEGFMYITSLTLWQTLFIWVAKPESGRLNTLAKDTWLREGWSPGEKALNEACASDHPMRPGL